MALRLGLLLLCLCAWSCKDEVANMAGAPCKSVDDCGGLECLASSRRDPKDLSLLALECGEGSAGGAQGDACEASTDCALGVCLLAGACAQPCETVAQCGKNERCDFAYARTATDALQTLHACVAMVDLPKDTRIDVRLHKQALSGGTDDIDLPATDGTTLFVLEHLGDDTWPFSDTSCRSSLCAQKLVTREAKPHTLFDVAIVGQAKDGPDNPVAVDAIINPVTVFLPNGSGAAPSPSGYTLTVEDAVPGDLRVTRLQRDHTGRRLDLNVFYVGASGFDVTGARGPMLLADALDEVDAILGQADIFIGEVRQVEVTDGLLDHGTKVEGVDVGTGFAHIANNFGVWPELPKLFELSTGAANVAINVFFVADIEMPAGAGGDIGALSGGTPAPWGMHGTPSSGVVVASDMLDKNDPKRLGRTLAHELGHMLGLFHTTEVDGSLLDPLDDTAVCPIARDLGGDGLDAKDCEGVGGDNLMFPTTADTATVLTEDQRAVLRSALILQ